jgi:hypothetical protein
LRELAEGNTSFSILFNVFVQNNKEEMIKALKGNEKRVQNLIFGLDFLE